MSNQNLEEQLKKYKSAYKVTKDKLNIEKAKNQSLIDENIILKKKKKKKKMKN